MGTPKEHVEEIRREKFSIGGSPNPLIEDLHQAVKNLSVELYAKDVHFLMELIQNAEDNEYSEVVKPSLEFIVTTRDITATGASATLIIFNNEKGFSPKNIESICSVGRSTKKGKRSSGYIGEKGIGFKSVFLITTQPYIFSNGYQIRFDENPCPHCGLGYIVPEWVEEKPSLGDIKKIYGDDSLPTTTIVLPLKPDKVKPVKEQLSNIHPELLLFLAKIRQLSVREDNEDPKLKSVSTVSIGSEIDFVTRKNMNSESYTLHLSAEENGGSEEKCGYYMWKQKFPVRLENMVERRMGVEEWILTLAFPIEERLNRGMSSPGVYAFLPTEMVTNFPFIIQADFVLASSRETILLDDKWNQGILECVPSAFMDAFKTLVIGSDQALLSSLAPMFRFIPCCSSPYEKFNNVREKIKSKLLDENIIPIQTYKKQKHFCKPPEVGRLLPEFWCILGEAWKQGVDLLNISSHGRKILSESLDESMYDDVLKFLGVEQVKVDWYAKCIGSSNLVDGVSEDLYLKLLQFVATNWGSMFSGSNMVNIPLLKYMSSHGKMSYFSVNHCKNGGKQLIRAADLNTCSWLIGWNSEFASSSNQYVMPKITQEAISCFPHRQTLFEWLENHVNVTTLNVYSFASELCSSIKSNQQLAITYAHFLYHSLSKGYLSSWEAGNLGVSMPLVDKYGHVTTCRQGVLVPSNGSKWAKLMDSNPWRKEDYVELAEKYLIPCTYAGQYTGPRGLMDFLENHVDANDLPHIYPPNAGFSSVDTPLTKENAFLLLDWIQHLKYRRIALQEKFLKCIKEGSWLKVTVNGSMPPSKSFLIDSSLGRILQSASVLVDIPLVDENFYGDRIHGYTEELKTVGVMFSYEQACEFIGRELMKRAASVSLSRSHVILMLKFIQHLRKSFLPVDQFVNNIKEKSWLKTTHGLRSPDGSVLYDKGWEVASQVSAVPFIDRSYFGKEICDFKEELKLLGVIVGFNGNYQVVIDHLKSPSDLSHLKAEAVILIMECLRFSGGSDKLINSLKGTTFLKTNMGQKIPSECFLYDRVWGCILDVFGGVSVIDHTYYGEKIFSYKGELKKIGVVGDFEDAMQSFSLLFKQKASQSSFSQHVKSFLHCFKQLKGTPWKFPSNFLETVRNEKWFQIVDGLGGNRCPRECILYSPEWKAISAIARLPFIDDGEQCYGKGIHEYKEELKSVGVITELKDGVKFVPKCLDFPSDPSTITIESVFSFFECIRLLMSPTSGPSAVPPCLNDEDFRKRLSRNWLKTHSGYRPPDKCLLFDSKWNSYLKPTDAPFIDENFYGPKIASYKNELSAIGVTTDVEKGCFLIADHLETLSDYNTIVQMYRYLSEHNWKPDDKAARKIWIPKVGQFVNSEECIIHDQDNLFGSKYCVLGDIYNEKILPFFSFTMEVRNRPSVDDYVELWCDWESSVKTLSYDKCSKFWMFVLEHSSTSMEKKLSQKLMKLPVTGGNNEIILLDKEDVFIPDNLHLKKLFEEEEVFVWYPKNMTSSSRCKLFDIYRKAGAHNISESLSKEESSLLSGDELKQVDSSTIFSMKGLVQLILGFLSCSSLEMEPGKRHEAVQGLINLSFFETMEPVTVCHSLSLSSGKMISKKANRMVRWERQSSKFFTQKMEGPDGHGSLIKYATYFSEAVSEGVLRENHDHVPALSELIRLAFLLKFNVEAIEFLMESQNLQIFSEDDEFLSSAFPF